MYFMDVYVLCEYAEVTGRLLSVKGLHAEDRVAVMKRFGVKSGLVCL